MKDFKDFNFSVIDVTMGAAPTMTINLNGISFNGKSHEAFHQHKRNALAPKTIPDFIRKGDDGYVQVKFCGEIRPEA